MKRGFTLVELLTVVALLFVIMTTLTSAVSGARKRARVAKAQSEMASIVAEVGSSDSPEAVAAQYADNRTKDPWGNGYRVTVRRTVREPSERKVFGNMAVWCPNAYSPKGEVR